ncbi:MAG: hypothetical protein WCC17_18160 [Candidatus Nitrosopolaris sp.]
MKCVVEPVIAIRNNATTREKGCQVRTREVPLIKKLGYQRWKQIKDVGKRWNAEIVFSSTKRVLGPGIDYFLFLIRDIHFLEL